MKLGKAITWTRKNRPAWRDGGGLQTTLQQIDLVKRILGADFDCTKATTGTFVLLQRQLQAIKSKKGKPYAISSINRITAVFHTVLNELHIHGKINSVPPYRQLQGQSIRERFYTRSELDSLTNTAEELGDYELASAIKFAYKTGCRQSELLKLTVSDVDFLLNEITFKDTKNGTDHVLPMTEEIRSLVFEHVTDKSPEEAVFCGFKNRDEMYARFKQVRTACGLPDDCLWHTFRHSCGTHLAEAGVPLHAIAGVLNHKNIASTQRYAKHSGQQKLTALQVLSA